MPRKKKIVAPPAPPMSPGGAMLPMPGPLPGAMPGMPPGGGMPPGMPPMPPKMAPKPSPIKRKMGKTMKVKDVVKAKPF